MTMAEAALSSSDRDGPKESHPFLAMKSSTPDLNVVLCYKDHDGNTKEKVYPMYSQVLAMLSGAVDTALSTPSAARTTDTTASATSAVRAFVFEGITPDLFELAFRQLECPYANWQNEYEEEIDPEPLVDSDGKMVPKAIGVLLAFYGKYKIARGVEFVDQTCCKYFESNWNPDGDLTVLVDVACLAFRYNLRKAEMVARFSIQCMFDDRCESPFTVTDVSNILISKLQPWFPHQNLWRARQTRTWVKMAYKSKSRRTVSLEQNSTTDENSATHDEPPRAKRRLA